MTVKEAASVGRDRAWVLHPAVRSARPGARSPAARLAEGVGLAGAIDLEVARAEVVPVPKVRPSTLFGKGKVDELAAEIAAEPVTLVVVDETLTPVQQRNLERAWNCKVLDRTALILEIFGRRARTSEGRLQVELAALSYQRSRLVRSWTHLERQRGGFGFMGGPGETQIEADRRQIRDRIARIERDLATVTRTRGLHREARQRVPYPVVALVGYTNAGKSTLFNRLTGAAVVAEDKLFATLDPTMRAITLPSGRQVILSDTVGFISELPTTLVAAFRATLEEVVEADVILHVRDIAHPETEAQKADVLGVLADLGIGEEARERLIEVLNKIDLLPAAERERRLMQAGQQVGRVAVSALTGEGIDAVLDMLDGWLSLQQQIVEVDVPLSDGASLAWLYRHGEVLSRSDDEQHAHLRVGLDRANALRFGARFPHAADGQGAPRTG